MNRRGKNSDDRLYEAVTSTPQNGISSQVAVQINEELSIRGVAGPYTIIGNNFAPGTTAADIQSAMFPSGGEMRSCRITQTAPTVMAEMIFDDRINAENVIATFNNKRVNVDWRMHSLS